MDPCVTLHRVSTPVIVCITRNPYSNGTAQGADARLPILRARSRQYSEKANR